MRPVCNNQINPYFNQQMVNPANPQVSYQVNLQGRQSATMTMNPPFNPQMNPQMMHPMNTCPYPPANPQMIPPCNPRMIPNVNPQLMRPGAPGPPVNPQLMGPRNPGPPVNQQMFPMQNPPVVNPQHIPNMNGLPGPPMNCPPGMPVRPPNMPPVNLPQPFPNFNPPMMPPMNCQSFQPVNCHNGHPPMPHIPPIPPRGMPPPNSQPIRPVHPPNYPQNGPNVNYPHMPIHNPQNAPPVRGQPNTPLVNPQNGPPVRGPNNTPFVNPQTFPPFNSQNFPPLGNPQNFPRLPNSQYFPPPANPQNFPPSGNPQTVPPTLNPKKNVNAKHSTKSNAKPKAKARVKLPAKRGTAGPNRRPYKKKRDSRGLTIFWEDPEYKKARTVSGNCNGTNDESNTLTKGSDKPKEKRPTNAKQPKKAKEPEEPKKLEKPKEPVEPKKPEKPKEPVEQKKLEKPKKPNKAKEPEESEKPKKIKGPEKPKKPKEPEKSDEPKETKEPEEAMEQEETREVVEAMEQGEAMEAMEHEETKEEVKEKDKEKEDKVEISKPNKVATSNDSTIKTVPLITVKPKGNTPLDTKKTEYFKNLRVPKIVPGKHNAKKKLSENDKIKAKILKLFSIMQKLKGVCKKLWQNVAANGEFKDNPSVPEEVTKFYILAHKFRCEVDCISKVATKKEGLATNKKTPKEAKTESKDSNQTSKGDLDEANLSASKRTKLRKSKTVPATVKAVLKKLDALDAMGLCFVNINGLFIKRYCSVILKLRKSLNALLDKSRISIKKKRLKIPQLPSLPRWGAIMLSFNGGVTHQKALQLAAKNIKFKTLGIQCIKQRQAIMGGLILEVFAEEDVEEKTDKLAAKLQEIYTSLQVRVTRPQKHGDLVVTRLDPSVTVEQVCEQLAKLGNCSTDVFKTGSKGKTCVWVRCPLNIAINLDKKTVEMGSTVARINLKAKKLARCYKCFKIGHVKHICSSSFDHNNQCFKCGEKDHEAKTCQNAPRCLTCFDNSLPAFHRLGGDKCPSAIPEFIKWIPKSERKKRKPRNSVNPNAKEKKVKLKKVPKKKVGNGACHLPSTSTGR